MDHIPKQVWYNTITLFGENKVREVAHIICNHF